jgi:hypothetical protein
MFLSPLEPESFHQSRRLYGDVKLHPFSMHPVADGSSDDSLAFALVVPDGPLQHKVLPLQHSYPSCKGIPQEERNSEMIGSHLQCAVPVK